MTPALPQSPPDKLNLAVIGGGSRCLLLLQMLESSRFRHLKADVVGVVDTNPLAAGYQHARQKGIFTSTDIEELWGLPGLDLIVELTDDHQLLERLARQKPDSVSLLGHTASRLLHDVIYLAHQLDETRDQADLAHTFSQLLLGASSEGIMVLDPEYRILRANQASLNHAGISREEAIGKFCFQVSHSTLSPCHSRETPCPMHSTLSTGESAHAIHEHTLPDGSSVFCDVSTYPILNNQGEVVQVLEVFRDITEDLTRRMEDRDRALKHDLARMVQEDRLISLGKLVASVAHEINNPMGSILNFTKLLRKNLAEEENPGERRREHLTWLDMTISEAERVKHIVGNLLSFARQATISQETVDLADILNATLGLTGHHITLCGIKVESEAPRGQLLVDGDPYQLQQVITNLLFNALEAMDQGGLLEIKGWRDETARKVHLEFKDNGVGIQPENLATIFEPFFSTKEGGKGTGLGLSVVYGIVRQHNGEVEVESQPGQGAVFRLSFPAAEPEEEGS